MKNQQGAALIVGLVVLLIMTLLGISSMSATTAELRIANNLQTKNHVFQAAETVVAWVADSKPTDVNLAKLNWGLGGTQAVTSVVFPTSISSGTVATTAQLIYVGCMNTPEGYDLSGGDQEGGSTAFKGLVHDIDVAATLTGTSGMSIGQQRLISGRQTVRPGCPQS